MPIGAAIRQGGTCPPPWLLTPTLGLLTQKDQVELLYPPTQVINHGRRQALSWKPAERSTWHLVCISYCRDASGLKPFRKRGAPCPLLPSQLLSPSPAGNQVANIFRKRQLIPPSTMPRAFNARTLRRCTLHGILSMPLTFIKGISEEQNKHVAEFDWKGKKKEKKKNLAGGPVSYSLSSFLQETMSKVRRSFKLHV